MYKVQYRYYNYSLKTKMFESFEDARKFWNYMRVQTGIRYTELITPHGNPMRITAWHSLRIVYSEIVVRRKNESVRNEPMQNQIEQLIQDINADYFAWQTASGKARSEINDRMYDEFVEGIRVEEGRKYIRIVTQNSVWGFIQKEDCAKGFRKGDILKAAGWNAPTKNKARGNIVDGGYSIQWTGPRYL